jgi:membrane dipeptidase
MRKGGVGICVATLLAPCHRRENPIAGWASPEQAWAHLRGQLEWYRTMAASGELRVLEDRDAVARQAASWNNGDQTIGCVLSLEGADPILALSQIESLHAEGLRAVGPAHYGRGRFANGTDATGGLGAPGRDLVRELERAGMILDVTHLSDDSFWEALDLFGGAVWASHSNCRHLVPHNRQFSDDQIRALVERGAVIGNAFDAWMLKPGWVRGKTTPDEAGVTVGTVLDHLDHVCQIAGSAHHSGIGSDLDGGFGREQSPADLDTIAGLQAIPRLLKKRGYTDADCSAVMHGNFLHFLENAWL